MAPRKFHPLPVGKLAPPIRISILRRMKQRSAEQIKKEKEEFDQKNPKKNGSNPKEKFVREAISEAQKFYLEQKSKSKDHPYQLYIKLTNFVISKLTKGTIGHSKAMELLSENVKIVDFRIRIETGAGIPKSELEEKINYSLNLYPTIKNEFTSVGADGKVIFERLLTVKKQLTSISNKFVKITPEILEDLMILNGLGIKNVLGPENFSALEKIISGIKW